MFISETSDDDLWVGSISEATMCWLYDPARQDSTVHGREMVYLFNEATFQLHAYDKLDMRHALITVNDERRQKIIKLYRLWEIQIQEKVNNRETYCYKCKHPLNERNHETCPDCGWLICSCGACKCHYQSDD